MTEAEWATCENPKAMLAFLADQRRAGDRKMRLFSCACCRRVPHALADERANRAVEVAERYADGQADEEERERALETATGIPTLRGGAARWAVVAVARTGAMVIIDTIGQIAACPPGQEYDPARWQAESRVQCDLLRDLFGPLPFRSVAVAPSWRTPQVVAVAQSIYEERAFTRMLELGQVLYQAGCDHRELLHHCLWSSEHVRGCYLLDLLLGRE
jgi:hypothetical protein